MFAVRELFYQAIYRTPAVKTAGLRTAILKNNKGREKFRPLLSYSFYNVPLAN